MGQEDQVIPRSPDADKMEDQNPANYVYVLRIILLAYLRSQSRSALPIKYLGEIPSLYQPREQNHKSRACRNPTA